MIYYICFTIGLLVVTAMITRHAKSALKRRADRKEKGLSDLETLFQKVRGPVSAEEKEEQRRNFAYHNAHMSNPNITREMIDRAADKLKKGGR